MLEEMETAARRIWLVNPNRSSSGKARVIVSSAYSIALCHTSSFSKLNIILAFPFSQLSTQPSLNQLPPRSHRALGRRFRNRLGGRVAEGKQDLFRPFRLVAVQFAEGFAEGVEAEVGLAIGAVQAVEECSQLNEPEPRIHE